MEFHPNKDMLKIQSFNSIFKVLRNYAFITVLLRLIKYTSKRAIFSYNCI